MAVHVKTTQPAEYYRKFLEQDVRPDGRELGEARPTVLNIGSITTAEGSALVKQGNTTVICGIKAELTSPKIETPKKGFIVPNVDLPPLCSAQFRPGPPPEQAQVASKVMDEILLSSKCINEEELCIKEGKLVWVLYCDMMCLDYDGNILDTCTTALLAALKTLELPVVKINEESGQPEADFKTKQTVPVHTQPVATSFAIFEEKVIFVDPTSEEESLATGGVTIVTQEDGSLCKVYKPGGSVLTDTQMDECTQRAHQRGVEVRRLIDETILNVHR